MANAVAIDGQMFKNGTGQPMARVVDDSGTAITQAAIASIVYSVKALDPDDVDSETVVTGHDGNSLVVADTVYDALQTDSRWTVDTDGYNFRFELDVSVNEAFVVRGTRYLVHVELTPTSGQVIDVKFNILCV